MVYYFGWILFLAKEIAKTNLSEVKTFYGKELDISDDLLVVNGRLGQSNEMQDFKTILRDITNDIKVGYCILFWICAICKAKLLTHLIKPYKLLHEMRYSICNMSFMFYFCLLSCLTCLHVKQDLRICLVWLVYTWSKI